MDGRTKVCGLIGNPVEHSMSPLMHNFYGKQTGINMAYVPFRVEDGRVGEAVAGAFALNIQGLNVTVPHKQHVMEHLTETDPAALAIGAVNTLVRRETGYKGYNTDGAGLRRAMDEAGIRIEGQECILLGAGGAARAAAWVLASGGALKIYLLNRSLERAAELAETMNRLVGREVILPMKLEDYGRLPQKEHGYLAVQSTSVGMFPNVDRAIIEDPQFYKLLHTGMDIVYTPARTRFMELTEAAGGQAFNGLDMLLYQGIIAYELWFPQVKVSAEDIETARNMVCMQLAPKGEKIILTGFMGAGKTSIGKMIRSRYQIPMVDTDQLIEERAGMSIPEIFASQGEEAFRRMETETLASLLEDDRQMVISVGGGLPLRAENRELLRKLGTVVLLEVTEETVYERIGRDVSDRPMLQKGDVRARIRELMAYRLPYYREAAHLRIQTDGRTPKEIADEIKKELEKRE